MLRSSRHIFFIFCVFFSRAGLAQEPAQVIDTAVEMTEIPVEEDKDTSTFALAGLPGAFPIREIPKKKIDSLKAADDFWYANAEPKKKKPQEANDEKRGRSLLDKAWFRDLLWIVILCSFIGVVIWYLVSSNLFLFRKTAKTVLDDGQEGEATDDIFALNYPAEIARAEEAKNFRLAVRLHYLQTLTQLAEKNLIDYRYGRTNSDYVSQLRKTSHHNDFLRLTRNFDYTWYGQFPLSADAYNLMRQDFTHFKNGLR